MSGKISGPGYRVSYMLAIYKYDAITLYQGEKLVIISTICTTSFFGQCALSNPAYTW